MYGQSSSQRTLALQLERLTREAAGFKAKMAAISSENTRLKRELAEHSAAAKRDALRMRRLEASLGNSDSELASMREQRDADARRDADERMEAGAHTSRLQQELQDARRELAAKNRWLASHEHVGELRDRTRRSKVPVRLPRIVLPNATETIVRSRGAPREQFAAQRVRCGADWAAGGVRGPNARAGERGEPKTPRGGRRRGMPHSDVGDGVCV